MPELAIVAIDRLLAPPAQTALVRPRTVGEYKEHGFSFRVPWRMRRATREFLDEQGQVFGFQFEWIGITGRAMCSFFHKDAASVRSFISEVIGPKNVAFVEDFGRYRGED